MQVFLFFGWLKKPVFRQGRGTMKRRMTWIAACLIMAAFLCLCCLSAGVAEDVYVENEWNFVDQSMDVSQGIPANATGVLDRIKRKGVLRLPWSPILFRRNSLILPKKDRNSTWVQTLSWPS